MNIQNISPLHVGVIGTGAICGIYLDTMIRRMEILQVDAIAARNMARTQEVADQYGIRACTVEQLLADKTIDIVVNLTPPAVHEEMIEKCLNAGKHVYTEKCFALTTAAAERLCRLADEKGLYLGCAPDTFFAGWVQTARKAIDSGLLGTVTSFAMAGNRDNDKLLSANDYMNRPGGGTLLDYSVYYLTVLTALLGPTERVSAMVKAPYPTHVNCYPPSPKFGQIIETPNDSQVYGILELESGVTGTLAINSDSAFYDQTYFAIYGTKGILYLGDPDWFEGTVRFYENTLDFDKGTHPVLLTLDNPFGFQVNSRGAAVADMAWAIREGRPMRASKETAYHVLDVQERMAESSSGNGGFVAVPSTCTRPVPLSVPDGPEDSALRIPPQGAVN